MHRFKINILPRKFDRNIILINVLLNPKFIERNYNGQNAQNFLNELVRIIAENRSKEFFSYFGIDGLDHVLILIDHDQNIFFLVRNPSLNDILGTSLNNSK